MQVKNRSLRAILGTASVLVLLAGCTPTADPVVQKVMDADLGELTPIATEVKGYCQPMELFCSGPLFEPNFTAPATADPRAVCDSVISLQSEIGLVAYSGSGDPGAASDLEQVKDFCTAGLAEPLKLDDETFAYQSTVLYDDGVTDGMGKVTVIGREPDGTYMVTFSLSRNLDRVGWIPPYGDSPPEHIVP